MKSGNALLVLAVWMLIWGACAPGGPSDNSGGTPVAAYLESLDISITPDGVISLPDAAPETLRSFFSFYTRISAPNGKPIHFLAQSGWTRPQIRKARNVLTHLLNDYPGSEYGDDKSDVADAMADRSACMVLFNTADDLEKAFESGLGRFDLSMQDLRANENPAEGDADYLNHITRDASLEEIWHLVHDTGIKAVRPDMLNEMRQANDAAAGMGWRAWPEDEPREHPNEYVGVLLDNYYDLWAVKPRLYEGRDIPPEELPDGTTHFGRYFADSRDRMKELDPAGFELVEKFFHPHLTYTPVLPETFKGVFSIEFDPDLIYTTKSRHLANVALSGSRPAGLKGNRRANRLTGNSGDNRIEGRGGDDLVDGGEGRDTAVFTGDRSEYALARTSDGVTVTDQRPDRDGMDTLARIEILSFKDGDIDVSDL